MLIKSMPTVLCPNCVRQGGLRMYMGLRAYPVGSLRELCRDTTLIPVLSCLLCKWRVHGQVEGAHAVFPDPHVPAPKLREVAQRERRFRRE